MDIESYLRSLPPASGPDRGVSIELVLNEHGYRRLSGIAEQVARMPGLSGAGLADVLVLVIEAGCDVVECQIAAWSAHENPSRN